MPTSQVGKKSAQIRMKVSLDPDLLVQDLLDFHPKLLSPDPGEAVAIYVLTGRVRYQIMVIKGLKLPVDRSLRGAILHSELFTDESCTYRHGGQSSCRW